MLDQLTSALQNTTKTYANLFKVNAEISAKLLESSTKAVTESIQETSSLLEQLAEKKELPDVLEAQKVFADAMRARLSETVQSQLDDLAELKERVTPIVEESLTSGKETAETLLSLFTNMATPFNPTSNNQSTSEK